MASQTIDPSLLDKRLSGYAPPALPEHAALSESLFNHTYHHEKPLDHTFMGEKWGFDLDLDNIAAHQVVDISDIVKHG
jgi:hypothetical protein